MVGVWKLAELCIVVTKHSLRAITGAYCRRLSKLSRPYHATVTKGKGVRVTEIINDFYVLRLNY